MSVIFLDHNRFISPLSIPEETFGDISVNHVSHDAGYEFDVVNMRGAIHTGEPLKRVKFPEKTKWHYLSDAGGVWMTDLPIEQYQHHKLLDQISGKVLVGGLGLGFATTYLAMKPEVTQVDVVELDPNIIKVVGKHTGKQSLEVKKKIRIINQDLFEYLKLRSETTYDYGFFDIWRGDGESDFFSTVLPLRTLSHGLIKKKLFNWNEDIMRGQLLMSLRNRIYKTDIPMLEVDPDRIKKLFTTMGYGSPYSFYNINWSVPFMRWYYENEKKLIEKKEVITPLISTIISEYVETFGMNPNWFKKWLRKVDSFGYPLRDTEDCVEVLDAVCRGENIIRHEKGKKEKPNKVGTPEKASRRPRETN